MNNNAIELPSEFPFSYVVSTGLGAFDGTPFPEGIIIDLVQEANERFLMNQGLCKEEIEALHIGLKYCMIVNGEKMLPMDSLKIEVVTKNLCHHGYDLICRISRSVSEREIARIKMGFIFESRFRENDFPLYMRMQS
jgi:hypothetical protein